MSIGDRLNLMEERIEQTEQRMLRLESEFDINRVFENFKQKANYISGQIETLKEQTKAVSWVSEIKAINDRVQEILDIRHPEAVQHQIQEVQDAIYKLQNKFTEHSHNFQQFVSGKHVRVYTDKELKDLFSQCPATGNELAKKLGYHESNISRIINGENKNILVRAQVAETMITIIKQQETENA